MENKTIDAACIGYSEEILPCERELQDLGEYSACTVVAHSLGVDQNDELLGTMLISFGPMYHKSRRITDEEVKHLASVINDVIERRAADQGVSYDDAEDDGKDAACEGCEGCGYPDADPEDVKKLKKEFDALVKETAELFKAIEKLTN